MDRSAFEPRLMSGGRIRSRSPASPLPSPGKGVPSRNQRFLVALGSVLCVSVFAVNGVLEILPGTPGGETVLDHSVKLFDFSSIQAMDSWRPMNQAMKLSQTEAAESIYEELFFRRGLKFQYPPSSLLVVEAVQLLKLSWKRTVAVLNCISWVLILINAIVVALIFLDSWRRFGGGDSASRGQRALGGVLAFCVALAFYPVVKAFTLGQVQAWLNTLYSVSIWLWLRGHPRATGVLVGLGCAIKPQQGLLLAWALFRRLRRFAAGIALAGASVLIVSLVLYGWENHVDYLRVLYHLTRHGEGFYPNQSVNGLLNRLLDNGNNEVWSPRQFPPYHPVVYWGTVVSSLGLIAAALLWVRRRPKSVLIPDFLIALLTFTIASPIAWEHHYGILLPIFAWLTPALRRYPVCGRWTPLLLTVAWLLASNLYGTTVRLAHTPLSPAQSYLFGAALLVLAMLYRIGRMMDREAIPAVKSRCDSSGDRSPGVPLATIGLREATLNLEETPA